MQPIRQLMGTVSQLATSESCLFTTTDLRSILPKLSKPAYKTLLSRAVKGGHLQRVCRGLYLYEKAKPDRSMVLPRAVSKLRPMSLNYVSLESVLSDAGVISQVPIQRIMVMSSGRSAVIDCGQWGSIEFIKTRQTPQALVGHLAYDQDMKVWRASVAQALRDMRATRRTMDLIDRQAVDESSD